MFLKKLFAVSSTICLLLTFTSCEIWDTIKEAVESADRFVSSYDDGIKDVYYFRNSEEFSLFMTVPEMKLGTIAGDVLKPETTETDAFGNKEMCTVYQSQNPKRVGNILYAIIELRSGEYHKDKLNCILKDVKQLLNNYQDICDRYIIAFRDENDYISWYSFIDTEEDERTNLLFCADYINYIKAAYFTYFAVENCEYYYQCSIPLEVYDIDIDTAFKSDQYTGDDEQIMYKKTVSPDILHTLDYFTYTFEFEYEIYPDDEENKLTVIMYPVEGENKEDNMIEFWTELIENIQKQYAHYCVIRELSRDGEVVHDIRDGEELKYKLDEKKWIS